VSVNRDRGQAGFSLVELMFVMLGIIAIAGMTIPRFNNLIQSQRANDAARMVERELQTARLKAVSASRPLRVRFNCPAAGQFRLIEVTGVASVDNATNRCDPAAYPSPGPSDALRSTPALDSPVRYLPPSTTVSGAALNLEFSPKGSVFKVDGAGTTTLLAEDLTLTVTRTGYSKTVTLNGLGRIRLN
jgi:Tfp pilus assembly protein FimT